MTIFNFLHFNKAFEIGEQPKNHTLLEPQH